MGKSSTILALAHYPARARRGHAHCTDAGENQSSCPSKMKLQDMTQRYRKFKRS
jgi:L-lactate utilization protein LutB